MLNRVLRITIVVVFAVTGLILTEYLLPYISDYFDYKFYGNGFFGIAFTTIVSGSVGIFVFGSMGMALAPVIIRKMTSWTEKIAILLARVPTSDIMVITFGIAIGLVLAAGALDWPVYPELRRAFTAAMQPEQSLLLGEERNLLKFTEQTAGELADSARSMWEDFTLPATPESARTAHGQPSPPAYARTDSYTPGFPLQFPLPGQSRKTSGYGWRTDPMGGLGDDFHIGNDLAAAQGTPVLAAADGVVRMAGSHKSYGNYLRILHADGDETLYAHMQYLFVKAGECVTAGQILGTVGETGNATGPHLHFEILHRGLRYDPAEALQNAS